MPRVFWPGSRVQRRALLCGNLAQCILVRECKGTPSTCWETPWPPNNVSVYFTRLGVSKTCFSLLRTHRVIVRTRKLKSKEEPPLWPTTEDLSFCKRETVWPKQSHEGNQLLAQELKPLWRWANSCVCSTHPPMKQRAEWSNLVCAFATLEPPQLHWGKHNICKRKETALRALGWLLTPFYWKGQEILPLSPSCKESDPSMKATAPLVSCLMNPALLPQASRIRIVLPHLKSEVHPHNS